MKTFEINGKTYETDIDTLKIIESNKRKDFRLAMIRLGILHGTVKEVTDFEIIDRTPAGF
tara:strand:- start:1914 stop:2093 length:180 start_codon:yes stop_codon:yes gene_type:complete